MLGQLLIIFPLSLALLVVLALVYSAYRIRRSRYFMDTHATDHAQLIQQMQHNEHLTTETHRQLNDELERLRAAREQRARFLQLSVDVQTRRTRGEPI